MCYRVSYHLLTVFLRHKTFTSFLFQSDQVKELLSSYSKPLRKSKSLDAKDLEIGKSPVSGKLLVSELQIRPGLMII